MNANNILDSFDHILDDYICEAASDAAHFKNKHRYARKRLLSAVLLAVIVSGCVVACVLLFKG